MTIIQLISQQKQWYLETMKSYFYSAARKICLTRILKNYPIPMKLEYSEAADLTTRNIKGFYSGLRKLILHGKMELQL